MIALLTSKHYEVKFCLNLMLDVGSLKLKFDFEVEVWSSKSMFDLKFEALNIRLALTSEVKVWLEGLNFQVLSRSLISRFEV